MDNDNRQFADRLLDASLEHFSSAAPRAGLEGRILAGVAARERAARRRNWALGLAFSTIAVTAIVFSVFAPRRTSVRLTPPEPVAIARPENVTLPAPSVSKLTQVAKIEKPNTPAKRPQQFPTPAPLSEQEKLLLVSIHRLHKPALTSPGASGADDLEIPELTMASLDIKNLSDSNSEK